MFSARSRDKLESAVAEAGGGVVQWWATSDVAGDDHAPAGLLDRVLELVAAAGAEHDPASGFDRLGGDAAADAGRGADDQHPCARQIRRHR